MARAHADHETAPIQRIGLLTGGGDAPGLNAVIRSVVLAAARRGWECHGIRDGFNGLLAPDTCGSPSAFDRVIAARFGAAAIRALAGGHSGVMVALGLDSIELVPLEAVAGRTRTVPVDGDTLATARDLGICLGD